MATISDMVRMKGSEKMSQDIGRKIKQLRKARKITQEDLAERVKIKRSTISNYEIGRRTPHLKDLQKLAESFGVGLDYFGVHSTDEVFDVLARAKDVFENDKISDTAKEELYMEFMKMYLNLKGE